MKKFFTNNKRLRIRLIFICLGIILFVSGCFKIAYIIQPTQVNPESTFNVTICIEPDYDGERDDYLPTYGIVGILLPEGWTVEDSIEYVINWQDSSFGGFILHNDGVDVFLDNIYAARESGYYWWGAKSIDVISLFAMEDGFIYIKITSDSLIGDFKLRYFLGEDSPYYKKNSEDPFGIKDSSDFMPIKVDLRSAVKYWSQVEWNVYPNPSEGEVFVQQDDFSGDVTLKVYDLTGKLQKSAILIESLSRVDLSTLSKGTYLVALEKNGNVKTKKLILQ